MENEKYTQNILSRESEMDNEMQPQEESSRGGKLFFLIFGLIIAGSVFVTYYRTMVQKNYIVEAQVDCDPMEKACFIWECDPTTDEEGEACTGDPENDIWYYNLAKRNASHIPLCDPETDEDCLPMLCEPGEKDCEEIFCNEENKLEQEAQCNNPLKYALENPPEEELSEEAECEEGDLECEADIENEECTPDDAECLDVSASDDETGDNGNSSFELE